MSIRRFQDYFPGTDVSADICIVGSGPAGATLAAELGGSGLRVLLLESGDVQPRATSDELNAVENGGVGRELDQSVVRPRVLGGASTLWSGRCAPLDDIDFQVRPWVPHSGWPIGPGDMAPFLSRSAAHLGLGIGAGYAEAGPPARTRQPARQTELDASLLLPFFWQFSRDAANRHDSMRFGPRLRDRTDHGVQLIVDASVVRIGTDDSASSVRWLDVAQPDGRLRRIAAGTIVLCAGGIENARLLLASNTVASAGLGNGHDRVGRFLMDHLRGGVAAFDHTRARALTPYMGTELRRAGQGRYLFCKGLRLSPAVQEREALLNCAVWLSEIVTDDDPMSAVKRLLRRQGDTRDDCRAIAANAGLLSSGLWRAAAGGVIPRKLSALGLNCIVEQRPDPDSRVTLAGQTDRHGVPLSRLHWLVNAQEKHTVRTTAKLVASELARLGLPTPVPAAWVRDGTDPPSDFREVAHHIGTTRMSRRPQDGVVDATCKVHGVRGLYVAGSSVFPTGGHANPTQMIVPWRSGWRTR